jgi:NADH-quinone oxidoreductase subunit N
MSTLAKVFQWRHCLKLLTVVNADLSPSFQMVIVIVSMASMTLGNIMALRQVNVKRMLHFQVYHMQALCL